MCVVVVVHDFFCSILTWLLVLWVMRLFVSSRNTQSYTHAHIHSLHPLFTHWFVLRLLLRATFTYAHGPRAEEWDLSNPLKTCSLVVERRDDALFLDFLHENGQQLFAQSKIQFRGGSGGGPGLDGTTPGAGIPQHAMEMDINRWIEQTVDSSRYFVVKIQGQGGREAKIGFGFRDREMATDLRETLQFYKRSMDREEEAQTITESTFNIPKLKDGERIHVNIRGKTLESAAKKNKDKKADGTNKAVPLLKKPPPAPPSEL